MDLIHVILIGIVIIFIMQLVTISVVIFLLKRDYIIARSIEVKKTDIAVIRTEMENMKKDISSHDYEIKSMKDWFTLQKYK